MAKAQVEEFNEDEFDDENEQVETVNEAPSAFVIDNDVELSARTRNTLRAAKYPFDALQVGQSFHIAATEDTPQPGKTVAGAVTNANTKYSHPDPSGELETRTLAIYEVDANGKRVRNAEGGYIKIGERTVERVKLIQDRHFTIRSVGNSDPRGAGARVFRDL